MQTGAKKRGMIFIVALLAMLGMVVIGTSFVASAGQQLQDSRRDLDMLQATAMADAGLNYFIWQQRYSGSPITTLHENLTSIYDLLPTTSPAPQISSSVLTFGEATADVWLFKYMPEGAAMNSYQVISRGFCRDRNRTVRAVLQGPKTQIDPPRPPWMDYVIFAGSSMVIDTSTNVRGDLASNGNIVLNTSGGGSLTGDIRAATTVKLTKNSTYIDGSLLYGTTVYDNKNNILTDTQIDALFSGGSSPIPAGQDPRIQVDGMNPQTYLDWANAFGSTAFYDQRILADPSIVTTPILYVNEDLTPGYQLRIDTDLPGPTTIFVNGDVELHGSIVLGTVDSPVAIIATGNIICSGTPTVNGMIWANGTFGGGTPNVIGTARCEVLGSFQGNPQMTFQYYDEDFITPPDFSDLWKQGSWELL
ncbi:MAG: hypothetical protein ACYDCO_19445 [Armatimonadota bacterium]